MTLLRCFLAPFALTCALAGPVLADTAVPMTGAYQKVGSSGTSVDVQNTSSAPIQLLTSSAQPTGTPAGQSLAPNDHRCWALSADLYALGVAPSQVFVTTGISCVGSGGSGGGGSGGSVTQGSSPWVDNVAQFGGAAVVTGTGASGAGVPRVTVASDSVLTANQGAVGSAPWLASLYQGGSALSSSNPLFAQLTAGAALIGSVNLSVGGTAMAFGQATMSKSLPVTIASDQPAIPVSGAFYQTTQPVSLATAPLPTNAATAQNQSAVQAAPGTSASTANAIQGVAGGVAVSVAPSGSFAVQATMAGPLGASLGATAAIGVVPQDLATGTASVTGTGTLFNLDTTGFGTVAVQITAINGDTVAFTGSNDGTTYSFVYGDRCDTNAAQQAYQATSTYAFCFPATFRYLKAAVVSGTGQATVTYAMRAAPYAPRTVNQGGAVNVSAGLGGIAYASRIPSSANSVNLTQGKTSAARVYRVYACNTVSTSPTARFIKFYNVATSSAVTVGTTAVVLSREILPGTCSSFEWGDLGFFFSNGFSYALLAGTGLDADTTTVAAGDLIQVSVEYQ